MKITYAGLISLLIYGLMKSNSVAITSSAIGLFLSGLYFIFTHRPRVENNQGNGGSEGDFPRNSRSGNSDSLAAFGSDGDSGGGDGGGD